MPGFFRCCAGIGDPGSSNPRGGDPERNAANFSAAADAADVADDFFAAPFLPDFAAPFFAPCLFDFVAISSPVG
jgi:hypothetical protein